MADEIDQLNTSIRELKAAYEQYFAGIERVAPSKPREEIKKTLRRLMTQRNNNTSWKFRIQTAQQTYLTYEQYWDRILRQIEEGTFKRDRLRAQKKSGFGADAPKTEETDMPLAAALDAPTQPVYTPDLARAIAEAGARRAPTTPSAPAPVAPPAAATGAYPESLRKLHETYTRARAEAGDARPVSIDALAETVKKQIATLKEQYKCERVEFKVAMKDGRAILKAIPK